MDNNELVERLLGQNDKLIEALTAMASPVEVIKALNPVPPAPQRQLSDPWVGDATVKESVDPWADDTIPLDLVRQGAGQWVDIPGIDEAKAQQEAEGG